MHDIYGNELHSGDTVIYSSSYNITNVAKIVGYNEQTQTMIVNTKYNLKQEIKGENNIFPVVLLGLAIEHLYPRQRVSTFCIKN